MTRKQESQKLKEMWQRRLREWKESGKSLLAWCTQKGIPYHQGTYWKSYLLSRNTDSSQENNQERFVEIKDEETSRSGITIEINGVIITLARDFDKEALRHCLSILRG